MVGELIRARRMAKGWSQTTLGRQMGWPQNYVSRVEGGKVELPQRDTLERLGKLLGVTLADFYRAAGVLEGLPPEVMPPAVPVEEPTGDRAWDPAKLVAWVEQHPDPQFRADLAEDAEAMRPEDYEQYCLAIARAWLANGQLAQRIARLHRQPQRNGAPQGRPQ